MDPLPEGIVSKPQFDVNVFKPGTVVFVKNDTITGTSWYKFNHYCLIKDSTPLCLDLVYIEDEIIGFPICGKELLIDVVSGGYVSLTLIK